MRYLSVLQSHGSPGEQPHFAAQTGAQELCSHFPWLGWPGSCSIPKLRAGQAVLQTPSAAGRERGALGGILLGA